MERFPEYQKLAKRFDAMAAEGLLDVKFFVRNTDEAGDEAVCKEVNEIFAAVDREEAVELDFRDAVRV